jgi:exopolysaccharide biosynthesis polyprenyl glycosylphosphotransferase
MSSSSSERTGQAESEIREPLSRIPRFRGRKISDLSLFRDTLTLHYAGVTTAAEMLADMVFLWISFGLGILLCPLFFAVPSPPLRVCFEIALVATAAGVLIFERRGLYRKQVSLMNVDEMRKVFQSILLLSLALYAYCFLLRVPVSPLSLLVSTGAALLLVSAERMSFYKIHQHLHLQGFNVHRALIYGAGEVGRQLFQKISQSPKLGYFALGFFDEDPEILKAARNRIPATQQDRHLFLNKKEELLRAILSGAVDEVFIARPSQSPESLQDIVGLCTKHRVRFRYIPYLYGTFVEQVRMTEIGGIPLVSLRETRASENESLGKEVFDKAFALVLLLLMAPVFLAVTGIIRLTSRGPAFFRQVRVGKDGKEFRIIKFRTLYSDSPAYHVSPTSSDDDRITPVGRVLRRLSLDELPQLFNVLRGEMSLVGPRPEMPFLVAQYNDLQKQRLSIRPGITGLWQISVDRDRPIHDNMAYDLYYIRNRSPLLDLAILVRTILSVLCMKTC